MTTDQFFQLGRLAFVCRALEPLEALLKASVPEDLPRKLDSQLRKAERYGLSEQDRVPFALHGMLVAPNFDRHPRVQAVLAEITKVPYCEAVEGWSDEDWATIGRESEQ